MLSGRWHTPNFEGATFLVNPHNYGYDYFYPILGRIMSHCYLASGHLPVRIAGRKVYHAKYLQVFLYFISAHERSVFKEALAYIVKMDPVQSKIYC